MTATRAFTIGSRGSDLALWQARHVQALLRERFPREEFSIRIIETKGDVIREGALYKFEDKGFFTKEIEHALLDGRIDIAVHSLKDLPTESDSALLVAAIPAREDAHDVWLSRDGSGPDALTPGARVGTSSLRRQAQLRARRPDLVYEDLRGNVPTRVRKLEEGQYDAVVLARAGLARLGLLPDSATVLPFEWMLPAPGQGALGIQVRSGDVEASARVSTLDDAAVRSAVTAERAFLARLQGGCLVPVGAFAEPFEGGLALRGMVADLSGKPIFRGERVGAAGASPAAGTNEEAAALGRALADELLASGAGPVLDAVREFLTQTRRPPGPGAP